MSLRITTLCAAGVLSAGIISTPTGPLWASGFDNTGIGSLDLLFDPARFALEGSYTYAVRNVEYQSDNAIYTRDYADPNFPSDEIIVTTGARKAKATPNVWNYQFAAKATLHDNLACLARLNNPGTILEELPEDWNGRLSIVKTELTSLGYDMTCALAFDVAPGQRLSVIGGGRYIQTEIDVLKMSDLLPLPPPFGGERLANVNLSGSGFGWRAGLAYEIPEFAVRASLFYDSEVDVHTTGELNSGPLDAIPMETNVTMPQGLELRLQTGIAPRWLAFAGVKWVNWSVLDELFVTRTPEPLMEVTRTFNWSDGWTITGGVGHQLTDKIQLGSSLTWDQGIGGSYSDTWQVGLGGSYKLNDMVTWSVGGALVYKTAHTETLFSETVVLGEDGVREIDVKDQFDLSYDASVNFGLTTKLKISF